MDARPTRSRSDASFALFIALNWASGIGTALSAVAAFAALYRAEASPSLYVLLFGASTACGLFLPGLGARWSAARSPGSAVMIADLTAGAAALAVAWTLHAGGPAVVVLIVAVAASANASFRTPAMFAVLRERYFGEREAIGFRIDQIGHGLSVVLGLGVGSLLAGRMSPQGLFGLDALTYLLSGLGAGLLVRTIRSEPAEPGAADRSTSWRVTIAQVPRSRLALPVLLSLVMIPLMALVSPVFDEGGSGLEVFAIVLIPSTLIQLAQGLGQLGGAAAHHFVPAAASVRARSLGLALAAACYVLAVAALSRSLLLALGLVVVAHIASNVVFVDAWAGLTAGLDPLETARVGGAAYTLVVAVGTGMTGAALLAGRMLEPETALGAFAVLGVAAVIIHVATSARTDESRGALGEAGR